MLLVPSKAFNHCILTLKSCKEPIFGGGGSLLAGDCLHVLCPSSFCLSSFMAFVHSLQWFTLQDFDQSGRWPVWSKCGPISTSDANAAAESNVMMNSHYQWMPSLPLSTGPCLVRERLNAPWLLFKACARRSFLFMLHLLLHLDDILYNCSFYKVMRSYGSDSETTILWNKERVEKHTSPLMKTFLQIFLPFTPIPSKELVVCVNSRQ